MLRRRLNVDTRIVPESDQIRSIRQSDQDQSDQIGSSCLCGDITWERSIPNVVGSSAKSLVFAIFAIQPLIFRNKRAHEGGPFGASTLPLANFENITGWGIYVASPRWCAVFLPSGTTGEHIRMGRNSLLGKSPSGAVPHVISRLL